MNKHGSREHMDEEYAFKVYIALQDFIVYFSDGASDSSRLAAIIKVFEEWKKTEAPLAKDMSVTELGEAMKKRVKVWSALDVVLIEHGPFMGATQAERISSFLKIIELCNKYKNLNLLIEEFKSKVKKLELDVDVGGVSAPISVILNPEVTGLEAYKDMKKLAEKMQIKIYNQLYSADKAA